MWNIEYYKSMTGREPAREFLDKLHREDRIIVDEKLELIRLYGPDSGLIKPFSGIRKLFEIKIRLTATTIRIFICFQKSKNIFFLHGFVKKSQETPKNEIKTAVKRLKEVL